jgi:hypothetical protein
VGVFIGMCFGAEPLVLTEQERQELQQMTQSRTLPAGDVMRSRMMLLLADGVKIWGQQSDV